MDRREAVRRAVLLMGGVIFAPSALGVLHGCRARSGVHWEPQFFDQDQARLITVLADVIIPDTETPGASQAGVPAFIEEMVTTAYREDARQQFVDGLDAFNRWAKETHGKDYVDLDPSQQLEFAAGQNRRAIEGEDVDDSDTPFFLIIKELTVMGYFTSEIGATQTLRYESVPGRYEGCISFERVGKTWAI